MTRKLLTIDQFRAGTHEGVRNDCTVVRLAVSAPEATAGSRTVRFTFSDGSVDRAGDKIDPAGWQTAAFMKNPVALWAHDSSSPPIGRASNVGPVGDKLKGSIEFVPADIYPFADSVFKMVKAGFIKAVSVGFKPLKWSFAQDKDRPHGIDFEKQELLEISVCPVPCNANALQEAKALGINTEPLREWAAQFLNVDRRRLRNGLRSIATACNDAPAGEGAKLLERLRRERDFAAAMTRLEWNKWREPAEGRLVTETNKTLTPAQRVAEAREFIREVGRQ